MARADRRAAKLVSRDAFMKAFVEGEYVMRKNLSVRILEAASQESNPDIMIGLEKAAEIVFGKVEQADENVG